MCFYQSYAREMAEANGWKRLATNSAKLVNIIGGYGYQPALLPMEVMHRARAQTAGRGTVSGRVLCNGRHGPQGASPCAGRQGRISRAP